MSNSWFSCVINRLGNSAFYRFSCAFFPENREQPEFSINIRDFADESLYDMPGRPSKYVKRGSTKRATKSSRYQRVSKGKKRTRSRSNRPRHLLNRSPFRGANVYPFTRSTTEYLRAWDAPDDHALFQLNSDSTFYIMKMKMQLSELRIPDYEEFQNLFTQYKITSWKTTITPTLKDNLPFTAVSNLDSTGWQGIHPAVPNLEFFIIPATFNVHTSTRD